MTYIFVGLGNPGDEYKDTRHNVGRILLTHIAKSLDAEWKFDKKLNAEVAKLKIGKSPVVFVLPNTFMNKSGNSIKYIVGSIKQAEKMVVLYDELDMPFGTNKLSFNRSSGGHKGVESIIKAIKTERFSRIRVGISPKTPSGKIKKPKGEDAVTKVILGKFKDEELVALKKLSKIVFEAMEIFVSDGREMATTFFNSK